MGGDRDRTKRAKMGRAAGEGSDLVVLTSDNPRSEEPGAILAEVLEGLEGTGAERYVIEERREGIGFCDWAGAGGGYRADCREGA